MSDKIHNYHFGQWPEMPWKENKMNTKEKKLALVEKLKDKINYSNYHVYQDQPWTCVVFEVKINEHENRKLFGFSKVCYPDEWDSDFGEDLAVTKALYKLAKKILAK